MPFKKLRIFFQILLFFCHVYGTFMNKNYHKLMLKTPWMVTISRYSEKMENRQLFCPGVLIYNQAVLASAQCIRWFDHSPLHVDLYRQSYHVKQVIFSNDTFLNRAINNGLALLILLEPVIIFRKKDIVKYPRGHRKTNTKHCKLIKYSKKKPHIVTSKTVDINFANHTACKSYLSKENEDYWGLNNLYWKPNILCSEPLSIEDCIEMEIGAPIVCQKTNHLNHTTWVLTAFRSRRLLNPHSECLIEFFDVSYMASWIRRQLGKVTWNAFYTSISHDSPAMKLPSIISRHRCYGHYY